MSVKSSNSRQTVYAVLLAAFTLVLSGCGRSFEPLSITEIKYSSLTDGAEINPSVLQALSKRIDWKEIPANEFGDPSFLLPENPTGTSGTDQYFSFTSGISFGVVYEAVSSVVKNQAPKFCESLNVLKENPNLYERGELPCGQIQDSQWKKIAFIQVPATEVQKEKMTQRLDAFSVPVLISRQQRNGSYSENSLDTKAEITKTSNRQFARDISVKFVPKGTHAELHICANSPGLTLMAPERVLHGNVKRRVLGINISLSGSGNVDFGTFNYGLARGCVMADLTYDPVLKKPAISAPIVENPKVINISYSGFKLDFREWWLKFIDKVADLFGNSIERSIERAVDKEINDFSKNELESGAWMNRLANETFRKKLDQKANQVVTEEIESRGIPVGSRSFKDKLIRECRKLGLLTALPSAMNAFSSRCEVLIEAMEIAVDPFYKDPEMAAKGCYSHYAGIFETKDSEGNSKWWSKDCEFRVRTQVRIPAERTGDIPYLITLLNMDSIPANLNEEMESLRLAANLSRDEILALADKAIRENPELKDVEGIKNKIAELVAH